MSKILISGGGIAGLTCAYWLHQQGHQPIVIEKAKQLRKEGYLIDFVGTGWDVANRMNLIPQLQEKALPVSGVRYTNSDGETAARFDLDTLKKALNITHKFMTLNRTDLEEVLYEAVKDKVEVRFDCSIERVDQTQEAVAVAFNNGDEENFDLLVGADGIHSNTRKLVFGKEDQFATYLGYQFATCILPNGLEIGDDLVTYNEPDRQANLYRVDDDEMLAFFIYKAENAGYVPQANRKGVLQTTFAGAEWRVPEILARIADDTSIFMDFVTQIVMPTWHNGRIVLIGDAAYCLTLISGQGASLAMGGAYFLAQALKQSPDHQTAFILYENRLRPYIKETQEKARRFAPRFVPGSQFQILLNNLIVKLANISFFSRLVGKQFNTQSLLETPEREPVTGLKRYLFRAPILLYRIGLGGLLGKRFLLLNHIGRKSGKQRQTVLEVVNHDKETDTFYIASGFGKKSDWYLNILEHPQVSIQVGWRKMAVTAVPLSPEESGKAMVDYAQRHPTAAKNLGKLIGYDATSEAEYRAIGRDAIPFIALKPR